MNIKWLIQTVIGKRSLPISDPYIPPVPVNEDELPGVVKEGVKDKTFEAGLFTILAIVGVGLLYLRGRALQQPPAAPAPMQAEAQPVAGN
jgi:hypothetical protein